MAKAAVFGTVLVLAVGLFVRWVVVSERDSFSRAVRREVPVRGFSGTCFWVRASTSGDVTRGIGSDCTGAAALSPPPPR